MKYGSRSLHRQLVGVALATVLGVAFIFASTTSSYAKIQVVSAHGEHLLGPHDTKDDAVRLAMEAAKRDALEQVASYLESVTVSVDFQLTREEIRSYTAGIVTVLHEAVRAEPSGDSVMFYVDLTAQIDTDEVAVALKKLRDEQDIRQELAALKTEYDQLQRELDDATRALSAGLPPSDAQAEADRRVALLNQLQSNALVQQAWSEWIIGGPYVWPYGNGYPNGVSVPNLLAWAGRLHPNNPHVPVVGTIITARTGAPLPPAPPIPPSPPGTIPSYQQLVPPLQRPANSVIGIPPDASGFRHTRPGYGTTPNGTQLPPQFVPSPGPRIAPPQTHVPQRTQPLPSVSTLPRMYHPDTYVQGGAPRATVPSTTNPSNSSTMRQAPRLSQPQQSSTNSGNTVSGGIRSGGGGPR